MTLHGEPHEHSAWFVVALRLTMGAMFLGVGLGNADGDAPLVVLLALAAVGAGRILGLDSYIERLEVGGDPLIERVPKLRYLLG